MSEWPLLDFSKFPNNMISGLTLDEINEIVHSVPEEIINLSNAMDDQELQQSENLQQPSPSSSRFGTSLTLDEVISLNQNTESKNTRSRDKWATKLLSDWLVLRDVKKKVCELNDSELNDLLPRFIHEVRRKDGKLYPGSTLVSIIAGIQKNFNRCVNFFHDSKYILIKESLNSAMKISTKAGTGLNRKSASVISYDQEEEIWKHSLGSETPEKLLNSLFYLNGVHFALRGGEEHSNLTVDQFAVQERDGKKC